MAEQIYFNGQGVVVSGQRITIHGRTYFTNNIASVDVIMSENRVAWIIGGLLICWTVMSGLLGAWGYCALGILPLVAVVKWMHFRLYYLVFDTSSGRVQALRGEKDALIRLKEIVEQAITEKAAA